MNLIFKQYIWYREALKESYGISEIPEPDEGKEFKKAWLEIEAEK